MEFVEVRGKTIDIAVQAALQELGLTNVDEADIEVLEEGSRGILGLGGQPAVVRVKAKPKPSRTRKRRRSRGKGQESGGQEGGRTPRQQPRAEQTERGSGRGREPRRTDDRRREPAGSSRRSEKQTGSARPPARSEREDGPAMQPEPADVEAQAQVVHEFLTGLLAAFGLEGNVETRVEDDIVIANVTGDQTEALVGQKAVIMQAVGDLARTVVQRKTRFRGRIRLDIAGYQERRREALRIYTQRLTTRILKEGGEIMLEPMNPADRKTVHDAVLDIEGVRSFSEGEEPNRSVVIALAPGTEPGATGADAEMDDGGGDDEVEVEGADPNLDAEASGDGDAEADGDSDLDED